MTDKPSKKQLPFDFSASHSTKKRENLAPGQSENVISAAVRLEQKRKSRHRAALDVVLSQAKSLRW